MLAKIKPGRKHFIIYTRWACLHTDVFFFEPNDTLYIMGVYLGIMYKLFTLHTEKYFTKLKKNA